MREVAVRIDQPLEGAAAPSQHEPFTDDDKNVRTERCASCQALYLIAYSTIYGAARSFEDLRDQLQLQLEEDHRSDHNHHSVIELRGTVRQGTRERKP
jgi:hypothetical protein